MAKPDPRDHRSRAKINPADDRTNAEKAIEDLSRRLDIPVESIRLLSEEDIVWPNGSLGCARPFVFYSQARVPGYVIVLSSGDMTYEYHGALGSAPFFCDN